MGGAHSNRRYRAPPSQYPSDEVFSGHYAPTGFMPPAAGMYGAADAGPVDTDPYMQFNPNMQFDPHMPYDPQMQNFGAFTVRRASSEQNMADFDPYTQFAAFQGTGEPYLSHDEHC